MAAVAHEVIKYALAFLAGAVVGAVGVALTIYYYGLKVLHLW